MLIIPPTVFRKRRKPAKSATTPPPGPPINVNWVATDDPPEAGRARWSFDDDITVTGVPSGLRVLVDGVWLEPVEFINASEREILLRYDSDQTFDGKPYSIVTTPSGIAEAARIVLPQSGTIIAP